MRLFAIVALSAPLFAAILLYCFRGRRLSDRPGAFHLLLIAVACAAILVSTLAVEAGQKVRSVLLSAASGTGDLTGYTGTDPSGALLIDQEAVRFPKPESWDAEELRQWQTDLRAFLRDDLYGLDLSNPVSKAPQAVLKKAVTSEGLIRQEFDIIGADGDAIPVVLMRPETATRPLPGVFLIPGHVKNGDSGLAQLVIDVDSYHQSAARRLALAGFATMTLELRGFGMRGAPKFPDHLIVAYNAILAGDSYKKLVFDDIARALQLFRHLPDVDGERIGMAGVSLGAELAVEFAAMETGIKAIAFHSHGGRTGPYTGFRTPGTPQPHYCHVIPHASGIMHTEDPFLLLAPRPVQGLRGLRQPFRNDGLETLMRRTWTALGYPENLEIGLAEAEERYRGHAFFVEEAVAFFHEHL